MHSRYRSQLSFYISVVTFLHFCLAPTSACWECVCVCVVTAKITSNKWADYFTYPILSFFLFVFITTAFPMARGQKHLSAFYMTSCPGLFWIPVEAVMGPEQNGAVSLSEAVNALISERFSAAALTRWEACRYFLCLFLSFILVSVAPVPPSTHLLHSALPPFLLFEVNQTNVADTWSQKKEKKKKKMPSLFGILMSSLPSLTSPLSPAHLALLWSVRLLMSLKSL